MKQELAAGKCYIPAYMQKEYGLFVGENLVIKNARGDICFEIAGVFAEPYSTSTAFDGAILIGQLPEQLEKIQYKIKIFANSSYSGEDIKEAYVKEYKGAFLAYIETIDNAIDKRLFTVNLVAAMFLAIGIIMLIVSGLIINFMIRHVMLADAKNIAVYKTLGYTIEEILKMYLLFYFFVTASGSVLGSKCLADCVLGGMFANLGQSKEISVIYTGIICIALVTGFVLLIVYLAISKVKNIKPIYAFNGLKNSNTKKKGYRGKSGTSFSPMAIALRTILRDKKEVVGIAVTVIVNACTFILFIVSTLLPSRSLKKVNVRDLVIE